jgi:CheY-like chemotaxis protein
VVNPSQPDCQRGGSAKTYRPLRVLVVDDYPDNAESMAMLLRLRGYEVDTAQSGVAGLRLAQAKRPDVVLLDVSMPGMDGLKVVRQMRKMFTDQPPLLIAITANGFEEARRQCLEAGFDLYFVKPVDPKEVERLLRELAGSS